MQAKKKLMIVTYGCQMNVYDSIKMADLMRPFGYEQTEQVSEADMVILNTCNIREKAAEKVYSELGRIKQFKDKKKANGNNMLIAVAGCVSQAEGDEIFKRAPFVDIVVGPQSFATLPELVTKIIRDHDKHAINLDFVSDSKFDALPEEAAPQGFSAFLTIQEGCDVFCKYCIVPYTRGAEFSRPVEQIYREANRLVEQGAKEITLLGQNVSAYHGISTEGEISLPKLIKILAKISGLERIRYTTSHPSDINEEFFEIHGSEPKLMPFLHLPVQSGSNKILKDMNRKYTREQYFYAIENLRKARPDLSFSSDFIVGYPGETDQDFEDTMDLVRHVNFAQSYSFKYSKRPGTPAAIMDNQVPERIKAERLAKLQELISFQQTEFNKNSIGLIMPVLFEKTGKYDGQYVGKTPYMQSVHVKSETNLIGKILDVKISELFSNSLAAELVKEDA
ncbi:MAG: tRNA (N6-isopentenyl adenosine(37)-C2)-methylthiotransferase MiaB [Sphingobacteriia bacterium]|nr:tRNA (N6-isopentenyl adenosine(37)-C2)-methylthiotransferase MiaB [Sphingobacteriia bacterium]